MSEDEIVAEVRLTIPWKSVLASVGVLSTTLWTLLCM